MLDLEPVALLARSRPHEHDALVGRPFRCGREGVGGVEVEADVVADPRSRPVNVPKRDVGTGAIVDRGEQHEVIAVAVVDHDSVAW